MKTTKLILTLCCGTVMSGLAQDVAHSVEVPDAAKSSNEVGDPSSNSSQTIFRNVKNPENSISAAESMRAKLETLQDRNDVSWKYIDGGEMAVERTGPEKSGPKTFIGLAVSPVSPEISAHLSIEANTGLVVNHVEKDGPAEKAGLRQGDVLAKLDDQVLIHPQQLSVLVGNKKADESVKVTFLRKGKVEEISVQLSEHDFVASNAGRYRIGDTDVFIDGSSGKPLRTFVQVLKSQKGGDASGPTSNGVPEKSPGVDEQIKKIEGLLHDLKKSIEH